MHHLRSLARGAAADHRASALVDQMSIAVSKLVWSTSNASGNSLLMMLALAEHSDDAGRSYPSVATLAKRCRLQVRGAQRILAELKASGEIDVQLNAGPKGCNVYAICLKPPLHGDAPPPLHDDAPLHGGAPLHDDARGGAQPCAIPLHGGAPEPSLNHQEAPSIARSPSRPKRKVQSEHPLFAEFYGAYPRKVARPEAAKAFGAINPDRQTMNTMLAAIGAQGLAAKIAAGEERFVPYPATWLNKRRWEDETAPATTATASHFRGAL